MSQREMFLDWGKYDTCEAVEPEEGLRCIKHHGHRGCHFSGVWHWHDRDETDGDEQSGGEG